MAQRQKQATLKDVSSEAGVSLFTASRALSGHAGVAESTQQRVREAARRLGYVANQHARTLKGLRSTVVGVMAASKANQYYATLVGALEEAVEVEGYSCFVADAALGGVYLAEREDRIVRSMIQQRVAAVVVAYAIDPANLALLKQWAIPVLFVDCLPPDGCGPYPSVSADNEAAGLAVGRHLAALGYRRWGFVGHARNWNTREPRQRGFAAAAAEYGADLVVLEGGNEAGLARRAVASLLESAGPQVRPQALFASNTVLLRGVLTALAEHGVTVPRGMAVVGFDDFDWAPLLAVPVTVIDQNITLIGRTAGEQVLALLNDAAPSSGAARQITIAATLNIRASCGAGLTPAERAGVDPAFD